MTDTTTSNATNTSQTAPLLRTPLYDLHVAAKARMVAFAGWEMPVQYAGVVSEVKAVREGVGIFDVSHMGQVEVAGSDAQRFLQTLTVNDVSKLTADRGDRASDGAAQYSLLCNKQGGVIDDIIVYAHDAFNFKVIVNASNRVKALAHFERHTQDASSGDAVFFDATRESALFAVQGPQAVALVSGVCPGDIAALSRFGFTISRIGEAEVLLARTGYTGEDGLEISCDAEDAPALWTALVDAGAVPCGLGARDTLRIEAALPLYGHEMDENTSPYAARLGWVVKLDKGDFVGRDALARAKAAPQTEKLVGLAMEGRGIPRDGYSVLADGKPVGVVTSGTFSPTLGKGIALARIHAPFTKVGTDVHVLIRDTPHHARVVPLPFYKRAENAPNAL